MAYHELRHSRVRVYFDPKSRKWYWYIVPRPHERAYEMHGPYETYEEAKQEAPRGQ